MRAPGLGLLAAGALGLAALALVVTGAPSSRHPATPGLPAAAGSVSAGGFTLASEAIDLPADEQGYPAGPHVDAMNANCAACHSPSMVLLQPALSPDQWKAEVTKMREIYRAPVAEADVPAILAYLNARTATQNVPATAKAQDPAPNRAPHIG